MDSMKIAYSFLEQCYLIISFFLSILIDQI